MDKRKHKKNYGNKKSKKEILMRSQSFQASSKRRESSISSETSDSEEDQPNQLRPIGDYIHNRQEMVEQMFKSIRGRHLNMILPDVLKDVPLAELNRLCVDQLEVMSKKRIRCILAGKEMTSSSGTEDSTTDEEVSGKSPTVKLSNRNVRTASSESEMPQPDSTSVDQPQVVEEIVKETIESDEEFSDSINLEKNVGEKFNKQTDDRCSQRMGSDQDSIELEEPVFDFIFDSSDDEQLRNRVLAKRTAVEFYSDDENEENVDISQKNLENKCSTENEVCLDQQKRTLSTSTSGENSDYDADSELEEGEIRKNNDGGRFMKRKSKKFKRLNNDAAKEMEVSSDVQKQTIPKNNSTDQSSDEERCEIRKNVKRKTFKPQQIESDYALGEADDVTEGKIPFENQETETVPAEIITVVSSPKTSEYNKDHTVEENSIADVEPKLLLTTDECSSVVVDLQPEAGEVIEDNEEAFDLLAPSEPAVDLVEVDDEPLDVDLQPSDDVWLQNTDDFFLPKVEDETSHMNNCSSGGDKLEFVDVEKTNLEKTFSSLNNNSLPPKPPPGVVSVDEEIQTNEYDVEEYDSEGDQAKPCNSSHILPPGLEPATELHYSTPGEPAEALEPSTSEAEPSAPKRTSIVSIKTLYKQLKAQKEVKKQKPKVYGAELPTWSIPKKLTPSGPKLPTAEETRAIRLEKGVKFDGEDENAEKFLNTDQEIITTETFPTVTSSSTNKTSSKKKSQVLSEEFLADLEKQKKEHEEEMLRKEQLLEKLKEQRLIVLEKEKETEEKLKKQLDLGITSLSTSPEDDNDNDNDESELVLFADEEKQLLEEVSSETFSDEEQEEGECSTNEEPSTTVGTGGTSFNLEELKSFSVCLNREGSRSVVINEKADKMKCAFDLIDEKEVEDDKVVEKHVVYGSYCSSREETSSRSHRWRRSDDRVTTRDHQHQDRPKEPYYKKDNSDRRRSSEESSYGDKRKRNYDRKEKRKHNEESSYRQQQHKPRHSSEKERSTSRSVVSSEKERVKSSKNKKESKSDKRMDDDETTSTKTVKKNFVEVSSATSKKEDATITSKITTKKDNVVENSGGASNIGDKITAQKLELYELEMRARAIRALMKKQEENEKKE